jgi:hypothetical protein
MRNFILLFGIITILVACHSKSSSGVIPDENMIFHPKDREIVESIISRFSEERKTETSELMIKVASSFLETPYVAHTLETGADEKMVINLRELDCTTYAENVLALVSTIKSKEQDFDRFVNELEKIRYRNGTRNGYLSRLHYFSDWIYDNDKKKNVKDISGEISHILYPNMVNFMSTHPASYQVLNKHPELVEELKQIEKAISERVAWYIPKNKIAEFEDQFKDGDIVAITTQIDGLDVTHVGFVFWRDGRVRLLHASSKEMKVVITSETLDEYLKGSRSATGIMIARPL